MSKHLSFSERAYIERSLIHDKSFAQIARDLHRSPSTIAREIIRHRAFVDKVYDSSPRSKCALNRFKRPLKGISDIDLSIMSDSSGVCRIM